MELSILSQTSFKEWTNTFYWKEFPHYNFPKRFVTNIFMYGYPPSSLQLYFSIFGVTSNKVAVILWFLSMERWNLCWVSLDFLHLVNLTSKGTLNTISNIRSKLLEIVSGPTKSLFLHSFMLILLKSESVRLI